MSERIRGTMPQAPQHPSPLSGPGYMGGGMSFVETKKLRLQMLWPLERSAAWQWSEG